MIEYRLLLVLLTHAGRVLTHRQLPREVRGPSHADQSHYLRIYMGHLRYSLYTVYCFEFDAVKSRSNLAKHGIDFLQAQDLWSDPMLLEIPAKTDDEPRYLAIGLMDGKHWSAVVTYRGSNIRLISVRRARIEEVALYES